MVPIASDHVLRNDDIFQTILGHLQPLALQNYSDEFATYQEVTPELRVFWKACNSLARTCKMFLEPTLDILWRDLYDLKFVLQLLSSFVVSVDIDDVPAGWEGWYYVTCPLYD